MYATKAERICVGSYRPERAQEVTHKYDKSLFLEHQYYSLICPSVIVMSEKENHPHNLQRLSQSHADAMVGHNHLDMLTLRVSQKVADSLFEVSVHGVRQMH